LFHLFRGPHQNITNVLDSTLQKLQTKDPETMEQLANEAGTIDPDMLENYRKHLNSQIQNCRIVSPATRNPAQKTMRRAIHSLVWFRRTWVRSPTQLAFRPWRTSQMTGNNTGMPTRAGLFAR
jgi:hypothetical protein